MAGRKVQKSDIKKAQYYVEYLGWKECRGVYGREFTEPVVRDLINRRKNEILPKLTIEVTKKEVKIVQLVEKKKGKTEKVKYPAIPSKDVTYSVQALSPDQDVVACIYLGFNPQTQCAVHVHVYRCDRVETSAILVEHLNQLIHIPEHQNRVRKIEAELVAKGQIVPRPNTASQASDGVSTRTPSSEPSELDTASEVTDSDQTDKGVTMYDSLAAELREKLSGTKSAPLLLPPKDYDTVVRRQGNLEEAKARRSLNTHIVGPGVLSTKEPKKGRDSVEEDSAVGDSQDNDGPVGHYNPEPDGAPPKQNKHSSWPQTGQGTERGSKGSKGSSSHSRDSNPEQNNGNVNNLVTVVPHWKRSEAYMPPPDQDIPRPQSPGPYPEWVPEEMTHYQTMPNYLRGPNGMHSPRDSPQVRSPRDSPRMERRQLERSNSYGQYSDHSGGSGNRSGPGKRYTASTLGLADRGPRRGYHPGDRVSGGSGDDGYNTWENRGEFPEGYSYYDNPYGDPEMYPPSPGYGPPDRYTGYGPEVDLAASMPALGLRNPDSRNWDRNHRRGHTDEININQMYPPNRGLNRTVSYH